MELDACFTVFDHFRNFDKIPVCEQADPHAGNKTAQQIQERLAAFRKVGAQKIQGDIAFFFFANAGGTKKAENEKKTGNFIAPGKGAVERGPQRNVYKNNDDQQGIGNKRAEIQQNFRHF